MVDHYKLTQHQGNPRLWIRSAGNGVVMNFWLFGWLVLAGCWFG